jgi:hypothetical protein
VSLIEKVVHWFSPPEQTCAKGPTPEESAAERQKWRDEIHGSNDEVQRMGSLAHVSRKVFHEVNDQANEVKDIAREGVRIAYEAIRLLEESKNRESKNREKNK